MTKFWEGMCSCLEMRYINDDGILKLLLKIEDQVYYLREVHTSKEFINTKGEEIGCRIFLNSDKLKGISGDHGAKLMEVGGYDAGIETVSAYQSAISQIKCPVDIAALS